MPDAAFMDELVPLVGVVTTFAPATYEILPTVGGVNPRAFAVLTATIPAAISVAEVLTVSWVSGVPANVLPRVTVNVTVAPRRAADEATVTPVANEIVPTAAVVVRVFAWA